MYKFGLIGKKLGHSWSQQWFEEMFVREGISGAQYQPYELPDLQNFRDWVLSQGLNGFNATIPYKEEILPLLDQIDPTAEAIGAVNCVEVLNGLLIGHNTDAPAFQQTLAPLLLPHHNKALILGTGGASKAVAYALDQLGISYSKVSRTPEKNPGTISYQDAAILAVSHLLIINTTPIGMWPNINETPWNCLDILSARHLCYDLIYNPEETLFLHQAHQHGANVKNGLSMLHRQAELSWEYWKK